MEEAKKSNEKLSYEQLEQLNSNLIRQAEELKKRLFDANNRIIELNWQNMFKRLDYLFKIIENKELVSNPVYGKALNSIDEIMFPVEEEKTQEKTEDSKNE